MPYKNIEDRRAARMRSYYRQREKWIAQDKEYKKTYRLTDAYYKANTINNWIKGGLIETDQYTYDELFEAYNAQGYCEVCDKKFTCHRTRYMDHCHKTGVFRDVVCPSCNTIRRYEDNK